MEPENNGVGRHPHALELSASLKRALAERLCPLEDHECDNQSQMQHQETENRNWSDEECVEPLDDEVDGAGNQTQHNDAESASGTAYNVEDDFESDTSRRLSCPCEPMVHYDDFQSVSKPSQQVRQPFFAKPSAPKSSQPSSSTRMYIGDTSLHDCDDDVVNICSPVVSAGAKKVTFVAPEALTESSSPAIAKRDGRWMKTNVRDPKWTPQQFTQYYELLGFLEHAFTATNSSEVVVAGDQLGQLEMLLFSLLPH